MAVRVTLLRHLPASVYRRRLLDQLAQATADAFGTSAPNWKGSPFSDRLAAYAEYTAAEAGRLEDPGARAADGRPAGMVKEQLYRNAAELGATLRHRLGVREAREAVLVLRLLYRQIGIEIGGRVMDAASTAGQADIRVSRCFFAGYYRPSTCRVMSALDAGVVDGLFGGASLEFSQRITDGSPCCRAAIRTREVQP